MWPTASGSGLRRESAWEWDRVQVAMDVFRLVFDRDLHGPKAMFLDFLGHDPAPGQAQRTDGFVEFIEGNSGIDQGPQGHVSADPAGAIEVGNFHRGSFIRGREDHFCRFWLTKREQEGKGKKDTAEHAETAKISAKDLN